MAVCLPESDATYHDSLTLMLQAFEVTVRPALDSPSAALDRLKMNIYTKFAEWGLPCPMTGTPPSSRRASQSTGAGQQGAAGNS